MLHWNTKVPKHFHYSGQSKTVFKTMLSTQTKKTNIISPMSDTILGIETHLIFILYLQHQVSA
jgi:hypothetical protein